MIELSDMELCEVSGGIKWLDLYAVADFAIEFCKGFADGVNDAAK